MKIEQTNGNGTIRTVETDAEGNYTATNLPPGDYVGTATASGFSGTAQKVTIFVAQTRIATVQPGSVNQAATVEQSAVSVDTTTRAQAGTSPAAGKRA